MKDFLILFLGVLFGVYFTYFCIDFGILSPVLASATAGLIGSLIFIRKWELPHTLGIAIYCGSFAGMGSVFSSSELLIVSVLTSLLIFVSSKIFHGFGGKLGFIAYTASIITEMAILLVGSKMEHFSLLKTLTHFHPTFDLVSVLFVCLSSVTGFYITVFFHHRLNKSAVFSSAFPSFLVGLIYFLNIPYSEIITVTFFSASFVGMVAEDVLPKKHFPILVGIHILIILLFKNNLGSYGGTLGTVAFFSVFMIIQLDYIANKLFK